MENLLYYHLSSIKINLCWYEERTNNNRAYDLMDHCMVDLETMSALDTMTNELEVQFGLSSENMCF